MNLSDGRSSISHENTFQVEPLELICLELRCDVYFLLNPLLGTVFFIDLLNTSEKNLGFLLLPKAAVLESERASHRYYCAELVAQLC